jgi:hypothetical protein
MAHGVAATSASGKEDGMIIDVVQHEDVTDVIASYDPDAPMQYTADETMIKTPADKASQVVSCRWDEGATLLTPALAHSINLVHWLSQPFVPFGTHLPVGHLPRHDCQDNRRVSSFSKKYWRQLDYLVFSLLQHNYFALEPLPAALCTPVPTLPPSGAQVRGMSSRFWSEHGSLLNVLQLIFILIFLA